MEIKHATRLTLVALFAAWCFDQLFWQKAPGISFFIFVLLCLVGGALLTWWEGLTPAASVFWLLPPVIFFAAVTFIRMEPFTLLLSIFLVLSGLMLVVLTWRGGQWLRYSLSDYFMGFLYLASSALARPVGILTRKTAVPVPTGAIAAEVSVPPQAPSAALPQPRKRAAFAVLRGLVLALPVIFLLATLLAAADPVFSKAMADFLKIFRIEKLGEYIFRAIYILIGAYLLGGVYLHALGPSRSEKLIGIDKPWLSPFLGWTEAVVVLVSVDLLFLFFVAIQFRYFFGGQNNIHLDGFTYAEYARRGFGELVAVAVISLLIFLGLSAITRRSPGQQRGTFSGLGIGLLALVATILVSAFQRLLLYEAAYGFSRLRTYTHVFMVWVGVLLAATVVLELLRRQRAFALALAVVCVGFGLTVCLLNVDGFITRQNVARAMQVQALGQAAGGAEQELDTGYLVSLSDDATPALIELYNLQSLPVRLHNEVGSVLACRSAIAAMDKRSIPWPSYNWAQQYARSVYVFYQPQIAAYPVETDGSGGFTVRVNGGQRSCQQTFMVD